MLGVFFLMRRRPPRSPLFPSTTLFRSGLDRRPAGAGLAGVSPPRVDPGRARRGELRDLRVDLGQLPGAVPAPDAAPDRKSTRLNSSHANISYAVFCLKKKKKSKTSHAS